MEDVKEEIQGSEINSPSSNSTQLATKASPSGSGYSGGYKGNYSYGRAKRNQGYTSNEGGYRRNNFRKRRRKVCEFCVEGVDLIDYKDVTRLSKFLTERSKIFSRRAAGTCAKHQRELAVALKRARYMALLPYYNG